jgi:hypothetical protein
LDLQSLGIFEPQKSLAPIPAPPPSPSPIYKFTSNSAADTQTVSSYKVLGKYSIQKKHIRQIFGIKKIFFNVLLD